MTPANSRHIVSQVFSLLHDRCTEGDESNRKQFVKRIDELLNETRLEERDEAKAWLVSWNKPIYANQHAAKATEIIERCKAIFDRRDGNDFDDVKVDVLNGLRDPAEKLARIQRLSAKWPEIFNAHAKAASAVLNRLNTGSYSTEETVTFARRMIGAPGFAKLDGQSETLFDTLAGVRGVGPITRLHLMMDLGYPVYKPDRWLVRFAAADPRCQAVVQARLGTRSLEDLDEGYLLRHLDIVCAAVDVLRDTFAEHPPGFDLTPGFLSYRFVDLVLSKFGMEPEASFGLKISGKSLLLKDPSARIEYPELYVIAKAMDETSKKEAEKAKEKKRLRKEKLRV